MLVGETHLDGGFGIATWREVLELAASGYLTSAIILDSKEVSIGTSTCSRSRRRRSRATQG